MLRKYSVHKVSIAKWIWKCVLCVCACMCVPTQTWGGGPRAHELWPLLGYCTQAQTSAEGRGAAEKEKSEPQARCPRSPRPKACYSPKVLPQPLFRSATAYLSPRKTQRRSKPEGVHWCEDKLGTTFWLRR